METRTFGRTDLKVTALGFGASEMGFYDLPQADCDRMLNAVLDSGANVIDTAACYPDSEKKIGQAIGHRRDEFVLVSKCGHRSDDEPSSHEEWSPELILESAQRSLRRLRTDRLDVLLLHSCRAETLRQGDAVDALVKCRDQGLTRFIGFSGDREKADAALEFDVFDVLEISINILDQQAIDRHLPGACEHGWGVIAKRPIANAAWAKPADSTDMYRQRLNKMGFSPESVGFNGSWLELALRFSVFEPGVATVIVGTTKLEHWRENVPILDQGPLPDDVRDALRRLWQEHDDGSWTGRT